MENRLAVELQDKSSMLHLDLRDGIALVADELVLIEVTAGSVEPLA